MGEKKNKKPLSKLLILILGAVIVLGAVAAVIFLPDRNDAQPDQDTSENATQQPTEDPSEEPAVALPTKYIILNYPAELKEDVEVSYEDLDKGQKITFTTDFTGDTLELFQFVISKSDAEGYLLGVLEDDQAGEMYVCVNIYEYSEGNFEVGDYTKLNALQERVNDIIAQFYEDPRFVANRPV